MESRIISRLIAGRQAMMLKSSIGEGENGNASEYRSELFSHWRFPFTGSFSDQPFAR
jgi:hypothetical protein